MARPLQRPDLAVVLAVALFVGAVLWLLLSISGRTAPDLAEPASAAEPSALPVQAAPVATAPQAPAPAGRENPLIPLPSSGTPVLEVKSGESVDLAAKPGGDPVVTLGDSTEFGSPTVLAVEEREGNWAGVSTEKLSNGELGWVKLDSDAFKIDSVGTALVIDLSSMTAEFSRDGKVEDKFAIGIGAPGTDTPTGHFSITDELDNTFNAAYGCCVLPITATQPNLPAGWSGGNRMALHGTSLPLGQANSTGCVHIGEDDLYKLMHDAPLGTPVTIKN
jgi:lipoprotein-anchoring transpeptidase ErfK/SrfK